MHSDCPDLHIEWLHRDFHGEVVFLWVEDRTTLAFQLFHYRLEDKVALHQPTLCDMQPHLHLHVDHRMVLLMCLPT